MAYDMAVVDTAYKTAVSMGASTKILQALFAAAIVESGFRNLSYGDRDSVGFLQQRAGWGSVAQRMNVAYATRSFVNRAKQLDNKYASPAKLAQGVQVSAFPAKYQMVALKAASLLKTAAKRAGNPAPNLTPSIDATVGGPNPFEKLIDLAALLGNPQTWKRVLYCVMGGLLLIVFLFKVTGDNKVSDATKSIVKTGIKLAVTNKP